MLIWVCALHCEAKPVIDRYRLKKSHENPSFDLYLGENMLCVVSGSGKIASATACAWIAGSIAATTAPLWINLGTAGAASHAIGSVFLLNQVIDADSGQRFYPAPGAGSELPGHACLTLSQASHEYQPQYLFDMEASGFMYSALRFSSAELVQSIKVVSDNQEVQTGKNRARVSELIQQQMPAIDRQAAALRELQQQAPRVITAESWQRLTAQAHFSQTQKNRIRRLWAYLVSRDFNDDRLFAAIAGQDSAKRIIDTLEHISYQDSERL